VKLFWLWFFGTHIAANDKTNVIVFAKNDIKRLLERFKRTQSKFCDRIPIANFGDHTREVIADIFDPQNNITMLIMKIIHARFVSQRIWKLIKYSSSMSKAAQYIGLSKLIKENGSGIFLSADLLYYANAVIILKCYINSFWATIFGAFRRKIVLDTKIPQHGPADCKFILIDAPRAI
jgi:hypothetical protein